jgi:fibronectin type 3 domain-containing protein
VAGYRVRRAPNADAQPVVLAVTPPDQTRYVDTSVEPGHTYFYVVTAFDFAGRESAPSNKVSVTIPSR